MHSTTPIVQEFRQSLEQFYASLHLAPPYHSMEKAVTCLATFLKSLSHEEQQEIFRNEAQKAAAFSRAFVESGLTKKHRGIIRALARSPKTEVDAPAHRVFLQAFI